MKKNFTNPEIRISLFNREQVCTTGNNVQLGVTTPQPVTGSEVLTNYDDAVNWLTTNGVAAGNIFSYKN